MPSSVLLSVGKKTSRNVKSGNFIGLNARSDGKSRDLNVAAALPWAFPKAPTARLCSLKDLSK